MKKHFFIITIFICIFTVCFCMYPSAVRRYLALEEYNKSILKNFIFNNMMDEEGGVFTTYIDEENDGEITKGHYVLSESQGILLQYAIKVRDKDLFDKTTKYIGKKMILDNGIISWRIRDDYKEPASAAIDDLRIINALKRGGDIFKEARYNDMANLISESVYSNLVNEGNLIDFRDEYGFGKESTICYQDLETLSMLAKENEIWVPILKNSLKLVEGAYVSNEVPLYCKNYNNISKEYDSENIDTLLSLMTMKNLLLLGKDINTSIEWIEKKLENDSAIYISYDRVTGEKVSDYESTSIYAYILDIAKISGNDKLYNAALNKVYTFQVLDMESCIFGAFGDKEKLEVFSFDNLNSLLVL